MWPSQEADGNFPSSTPGKARDHGKEQMQRLAKVYFSLCVHMLWCSNIMLFLVRLLQFSGLILILRFFHAWQRFMV